jgi:hypothetical protein
MRLASLFLALLTFCFLFRSNPGHRVSGLNARIGDLAQLCSTLADAVCKQAMQLANAALEQTNWLSLCTGLDPEHQKTTCILQAKLIMSPLCPGTRNQTAGRAAR